LQRDGDADGETLALELFGGPEQFRAVADPALEVSGAEDEGPETGEDPEGEEPEGDAGGRLAFTVFLMYLPEECLGDC
jgi:hypothetical protein